MPCADVSENLKVILDHDDRVIYYALSKDSCSGAVGKPSLLKKWIKDRPAAEILAAGADDIHRFYPTRSNTWQFLYAKHLFAVQKALQAVLGETTGRPTDYCAIHSVTCTPDGVEILARMNIDLMTEDIKACGNCGCG
ncbi:hypothetical protein GF420_00140 [candidate division GN15 bacterium]|jgi:hypothetical protein|nr:hypothetical protein [candidate division GN15 bacterium]